MSFTRSGSLSHLKIRRSSNGCVYVSCRSFIKTSLADRVVSGIDDIEPVQRGIRNRERRSDPERHGRGNCRSSGSNDVEGAGAYAVTLVVAAVNAYLFEWLYARSSFRRLFGLSDALCDRRPSRLEVDRRPLAP